MNSTQPTNWKIEIDGNELELDAIAVSALDFINLLAATERMPVAKDFTLSEIMIIVARHLESKADGDKEAAMLVRVIVEKLLEPSNRGRRRHLRLVRSPDSNGSSG
jgi:hypothetical protein